MPATTTRNSERGESRRRQPYLGLVGNGETAALIAPNLDVAWFCPGRFDALPLFAAALDPKRGGKLGLRLRCEKSATAAELGTQGYLGDTNILATLVRLATDTEGNEVRAEVFDYFPWRKPYLLRDIRLRNDTARAARVRVEWDVNPIRTVNHPVTLRVDEGVAVDTGVEVGAAASADAAAGAGTAVSSAASHDWTVAIGTSVMGAERAEVEDASATVGGAAVLDVPPGAARWVRLAVAYAPAGVCAEAADRLREALIGVFRQPGSGHHERRGEPASEPEFEPAQLREAKQFWASWLSKARQPALAEARAEVEAGAEAADLGAAYRRSLLALKLLVYEPTGAIVAAPTASFPATPGGGDNWDYRYVWLRDGYLCAIAFDEAGLPEESRRFYDFVRRLQAEDGSWPNPLFDIDGNLPEETILPELEGPNGEKPVRLGNAALSQLQLDNTGNVVDGLWRHFLATGDRNHLRECWPAVKRALGWLEANWRRPENGIWEFRDAARQWVYGKVMCCAAFRAGALIASELGCDDERRRHWEAEAAAVREEVVKLGWSSRRQAFVQFYGSPTPSDDADGSGCPPRAICDNGGQPLDISVLALAFYGLVKPGDPRMAATVRAIETPMEEGGLNIKGGIARFEGAALPFYLPTLWLARFHLLAGNEERALALVRTCLSCATDLNLMAEHFDPVGGRQWGNFPQAFSHEELVRTLLALASGSAEIERT